MTESIQGPVDSAITQLMQHFEVAMWAEDIAPERALRVLNRVLFGHPSGTPQGGHADGVPDWAEEEASQMRIDARHAVASELEQDVHSTEVTDGLRLVTLALVRQVLQSAPGPIEQALRSE